MSGQVTDDIKANLKFLDYTIEKLEFYQNTHFEEGPVEIDFHVKKDVTYMGEQDENLLNSAVVSLEVCIFEEAEKNNYPFSLTIKLVGFFEIENYEPNSRNLIETNAVAILFPYIRSLVTTTTATANVNPLILPPINVVKLLQNQQNGK